MKQDKNLQAQREVERHVDQVEHQRQKVLKRLQELGEKIEEKEKLRKQEEERLEQERLQISEQTPAATFGPGVQSVRSTRPAGSSAPTGLPPWTRSHTGLENAVTAQAPTFTPADASPFSVMAIIAAPNGSVEQELFTLRTIRNWIDMRINQLSEGRRT